MTENKGQLSPDNADRPNEGKSVSTNSNKQRVGYFARLSGPTFVHAVVIPWCDYSMYISFSYTHELPYFHPKGAGIANTL